MAASIHVTDHAVDRTVERLGWQGSELELRNRIHVEVADALAASRVCYRKPNWTRDSFSSGRGGVYVWPAGGSHCWSMEHCPDGFRVMTVVRAKPDALAA